MPAAYEKRSYFELKPLVRQDVLSVATAQEFGLPWQLAEIMQALFGHPLNMEQLAEQQIAVLGLIRMGVNDWSHLWPDYADRLLNLFQTQLNNYYVFERKGSTPHSTFKACQAVGAMIDRIGGWEAARLLVDDDDDPHPFLRSMADSLQDFPDQQSARGTVYLAVHNFMYHPCMKPQQTEDAIEALHNLVRTFFPPGEGPKRSVAGRNFKQVNRRSIQLRKP